MIDKYNITIHSKNTKKIECTFYLDEGYYYKNEYNSLGNIIYYEDSYGFWYKSEFGSRGNQIYYENCYGEIKDDRKIK